MSTIKGKVAVLMGGRSGERPVSLQTGGNVLASLQRSGVDAFGIDVGADIARLVASTPIDYAFIALHGRGGEDGTIQGLLELLEIPYTGSGVSASAVTMNKILTKTLCEAVGIPTPASLVVDASTDPQDLVARIGLPMAIKPISEGSTLGVTKVTDVAQIPEAIAHAAQFNGGVMAEKWVMGREMTIGILGEEPLPLLEIHTPNELYDFEAKYESDATQYLHPEDVSQELEQTLQQLALKAFRCTGCSGWGRVDVMLDDDLKPWLIEINTIPGMTEHSLVPKAAKLAGMSFDELVLTILQGAGTGR